MIAQGQHICHNDLWKLKDSKGILKNKLIWKKLKIELHEYLPWQSWVRALSRKLVWIKGNGRLTKMSLQTAAHALGLLLHTQAWLFPGLPKHRQCYLRGWPCSVFITLCFLIPSLPWLAWISSLGLCSFTTWHRCQPGLHYLLHLWSGPGAWKWGLILYHL